MLLDLDLAYDEWKKKGLLTNLAGLRDAIDHGAVKRVRPKAMTACVIIAGLLPILWAHGAGADTMKRIAAPMVGGMVSSTILTLLIIPAIYFLYRSRGLEETSPPTPQARWTKPGLALLAALLAAGGGVWAVRHNSSSQPNLTAPLLTQRVGDYQFTVLGRKEELAVGVNPIRIEVSDPVSGQKVEVGGVSLQLNMDMGGQWSVHLGYAGPVDSG